MDSFSHYTFTYFVYLFLYSVYITQWAKKNVIKQYTEIQFNWKEKNKNIWNDFD